MHPIETTPQVRATLALLKNSFGNDLTAVYLHGSAVADGLRPDSDIDLMAIVERSMSETGRSALLAGLLPLSSPHPAPPEGPRCIELMIFRRNDLSPAPYPARAEYLYGEWLRDTFKAGAPPQPVCDPEITLVLAQARGDANVLLGPPPAELLPEIPIADVRSAMRDALPALIDGLAGDERNVLLTLARMWRTAETGDFVSKDAAASWAETRLPSTSASVLADARVAYLGLNADDWSARADAVRQTARHLRDRVIALL